LSPHNWSSLHTQCLASTTTHPVSVSFPPSNCLRHRHQQRGVRDTRCSLTD
jgi:hypothetical protein